MGAAIDCSMSLPIDSVVERHSLAAIDLRYCFDRAWDWAEGQR